MATRGFSEFSTFRRIPSLELHFHNAHEPHPTRYCWKTANFVQLKISCCLSWLWRNWVNWVSLTMLVSFCPTPWSGRWKVLRCGHSCFSSGHEGWLDQWLPCVTFHQRCCWGWVNWKSELSKLTCGTKLQNSVNYKCRWQGNTLRSSRLPTRHFRQSFRALASGAWMLSHVTKCHLNHLDISNHDCLHSDHQYPWHSLVAKLQSGAMDMRPRRWVSPQRTNLASSSETSFCPETSLLSMHHNLQKETPVH